MYKAKSIGLYRTLLVLFYVASSYFAQNCTNLIYIGSVQWLSHVRLSVTPRTAAYQASLSITNSRSLLMSIELVMPSNHIMLCHTLLFPLSIFPSIRVFSNGSALRIRWPKYWSYSISPSNEYSGLISFRIDWLNLGYRLVRIELSIAGI